MASIRLSNVTKRFGKTTAISELNLEIEDGEFFCVLGPPGAGKTTLLRLIVGLEKPDSGSIFIGGEAVNDLHPSRRDISMIFQNLALYPDKSVFENIAFPLRQQKMEEGAIKEKVTAVSKQLKIDWLLEKLPSQLSGGERQRVAIGRAIVRQPKAYLMDEPLSNLDALLRLEMRVSLKELQTSLKETFVYVTHDQVEALSMGDRIAIMNMGVLQQIDDPGSIYRHPRNMFVATILGNPPMNFLKCAVKEAGKSALRVQHEAFTVAMRESRKAGSNRVAEAKGIVESLRAAAQAREVVLGIRPEDVKIDLERGGKGSTGRVNAGFPVDAEVYVTEPLGNETIVDIKLGEGVIKVLAESDFPGQPGQKVRIRMNEHKLHFFDASTHQCIHHTSDRDEIEIGSA
jgi:multiple sugar transport system ATP-binding protein